MSYSKTSLVENLLLLVTDVDEKGGDANQNDDDGDDVVQHSENVDSHRLVLS